MARIKLNGYVVDDTYGPIYEKYNYPVIYPARVRQAIEDTPEGEDLVLELNSGGGNAYSGFEIYSVLRNAPCNTVAEIQSIAGSAASTIACGCKTVLMSPVALLMIHDPSIRTDGNIREHKESLHLLHSVKESILNGYVARCGSKCSRERLHALMAKETWLPAQEAVEIGLADGILYEDVTNPSAVINCVQAGFRDFAVGSALPSIEELQALEAADGAESGKPGATPAGTPPAPKSESWACQAALEIEKNRYI